MPAREGVQYTVRGISPEIDKALRRRARQRGISLNQLLVEELSASGDGVAPRRYRALSDIGGRWRADPGFDRIVAEQRRIDPDLWK